MPAEWERHDATWIGWPTHEPDWPGKFAPIPWVYAEIVRALAPYERVEILCQDDAVCEEARAALTMHGVDAAQYRLHVQPTDRVWLRDSGPTGVHRADGSVALVHWGFDAWSKYDNYALDVHVPEAISRVTALPRVEAMRHDNGQRLTLEGGGIETDGLGTMLVTEEWLLSDVQVRNPGFTRADYERAFHTHLGISHTIWLGEGCVGDDTHGHVDDIARFFRADAIVAAEEPDPRDANHRALSEVWERLRSFRTPSGRKFELVPLPMPRAFGFGGRRVPASYANFLVINGAVLVPTFRQPRRDAEACAVLGACFPGRQVVPVDCRDLIWGLGAIHCLTQQQPA